jgi:ribose/xylose/arabinose/galactoside ABC-type transport system permease subunit
MRLRLVPGWSAAAILAIEFAFFAVPLSRPGLPQTFATLDNVALILIPGIYGIAAVGAAMIIGAGGIDLAPGAVIALASVIAGHLFTVEAWPLWAAMLCGVGTGVVTGGLSAALIVAARLPPFIATLGVMGIARGAAFLITEGRFYDLSRWLAAGAAPLGVPRRAGAVDAGARGGLSGRHASHGGGAARAGRRRQRAGGAIRWRQGRAGGDGVGHGAGSIADML